MDGRELETTSVCREGARMKTGTRVSAVMSWRRHEEDQQKVVEDLRDDRKPKEKSEGGQGEAV